MNFLQLRYYKSRIVYLECIYFWSSCSAQLGDTGERLSHVYYFKKKVEYNIILIKGKKIARFRSRHLVSAFDD